MSKVAVLKTKPDTVLGDYKTVMQLAEYKKHLPKSKDTIMKLNLSWSLFFPACSTPPWQLDGVLGALFDGGYKNILPVENRTVVTNPLKGAKLNKWDSVLNKYGLDFIPLTTVGWTPYEPGSKLLALDRVFPEGLEIPEMFLGKNIVHLPTQKTHGHTTITGAMKNAFGGLITSKRHHCHKMIHEVLVDLLIIQKEIHTGVFAVMDGTVAGDGAGPRAMQPKVKNYVLASADQVAIDAVSAKMMGFEPMDIPFIRLAHERGLGVGDFDEIDIVGEDVSKVDYNFHTKKSLVVWADQLFRRGALSLLEPLIFHTPLFTFCIWGSALFHDYAWYPLEGRRRIDEFMKTDWGELFSKY